MRAPDMTVISIGHVPVEKLTATRRSLTAAMRDPKGMRMLVDQDGSRVTTDDGMVFVGGDPDPYHHERFVFVRDRSQEREEHDARGPVGHRDRQERGEALDESEGEA